MFDPAGKSQLALCSPPFPQGERCFMLACPGSWALPCLHRLGSAGWCLQAEGLAALTSLSTFICWPWRGRSSPQRLLFPLSRGAGCDVFLPSVRNHAVLHSHVRCGSCLGLGTHSCSYEVSQFLCNLCSAGSKNCLIRVRGTVPHCDTGKPVEWGGKGQIPKFCLHCAEKCERTCYCRGWIYLLAGGRGEEGLWVQYAVPCRKWLQRESIPFGRC